MALDLQNETKVLKALPVKDLQARYRELWGASTNSRNRDYLIKRITWRMQELETGGLSERAKQRLVEVLDDCALRVRPPQSFLQAVDAVSGSRTGRGRGKGTGMGQDDSPGRDSRLPPVGSELRRAFRGTEVVVQVLDRGFLYQHRYFPSLSAVAKEVTGQHWNGFLFFGLTHRRGTGS